jgi:nucleoside-diphosphate-sugar epimerase
VLFSALSAAHAVSVIARRSSNMGQRIFLAGASGAIGRRLVPLLCRAGHKVAGTTRSADKAGMLEALGARPLIVDVFDAVVLARAVQDFAPAVVLHQLTDLPPGLDPARMEAAIAGNARIRAEGTRNLVAAALAAGARRIVAQSIAWLYAPGPEPHDEGDPLDRAAEGARAITLGGVVALEQAVLGSHPLAGAVLRYGQFYGPGTGRDAPTGATPVHIDAAAQAALLAVERAAEGIFNIAEPTQHLATDKARHLLGWDPAFRLEAQP